MGFYLQKHSRPLEIECLYNCLKPLMLNTHKDKIAQNFGRHHKHYVEHAYLQKNIAKTLSTMLPELPKNSRLLELGCGTGFLTKHLTALYPNPNIKFDITDLSRDMVNYTAAQYQDADNMRFFILDAEQKTDINEGYDLIVTSMTLQWLDLPHETLNALSQIAPVYYATLGPDNFKEWRSCLQDLGIADGTRQMPPLPGFLKQEAIKGHYPDAMSFLKTLKANGTSIPQAGYKPLSAKNLRRAMAHFDTYYDNTITWDIVYGALTKA